MKRTSIENPAPSNLERFKRVFGLGVYAVVGCGDRTQAQQHMIVQMYERGGSAFRILHSAEAPFRDSSDSQAYPAPPLRQEEFTPDKA